MASKEEDKPQGRPYIGVQFECCNVYTRVYRPEHRNFYLARCPKCGKSVRFEVSEGGSQSRIWRVR